MTRVPTIKGQSFPAWDARSALATGVTFITSPQGADHTAGRLQGVLEFDRFEPGTIAPLSQGMQVNVCVQDTIGLCQFSDGTPDSAVFLARLLSAYYGEAFTVEDFIKLGEKIFRTEVGFNRRAGISLKEDRLPEFMLKESLPPTNAMFTVDQEEIDSAFAHLREDNED